VAPSLTIITRKQWGAGPCTVGYPIPHDQIVGHVIHHDVIAFNGWASDIVAESIKHARAVKRSRPDLGVGDDGEPDWPYIFGCPPDYLNPDHSIIVEGRGWRRTGAHTHGYNSTRCGIVLFGDYRHGHMGYTPGQLRAARYLGRWLAQPEDAKQTEWHKRLKATECPGENGIELALHAQPPFTHADLAVFYPEEPMPAVRPGRHNPGFVPAAPIVDSIAAPGGGSWAVAADGSVYAFGGAPYFGGTNGKPYFAGFTAARIELPNAEESAQGRKYVVVATASEKHRYAFPE
jgi:hypothetical protein